MSRVGQHEGLAYAYWGWGLLENAAGRRQTTMEELAAASAIFGKLGMTSEHNAIERELGNPRIAPA